MASFGSFETEREVYADPIYTVYSATRTGDPKSEYAIKVFSLHRTPLETGSAETLEPLLDDIDNSRSDAIRVQAKGASASKFVAPVLLTGQDERGVWYATKFYARSVNRIISGKVALSRDALHHIIRSIGNGALDLKRACGRSHGDIRPSNVQISKSERLLEAEVVLSDPLPGGEREADRYELSDLQAIGRIILQLITQRALEENEFLVLPILSSPDWVRVFGKEADTWLAICNRLLDPNLTLQEYSLEQLLADLVALEPKKHFSPKWAIAAVAVVLVLVGGFLIVRAFTGKSNETKVTPIVHNDPIGEKPRDTNIPPTNPPVSNPPPAFAEIIFAQFDSAPDLKSNPELQKIFAGLRRNPTGFTNDLRSWWSSRPTGMPAIKDLPANEALDRAVSAELSGGTELVISTNLMPVIAGRLQAKQNLADAMSGLSNRWRALSDKTSIPSNAWAQLSQPGGFITKLLERDFRKSMGPDSGLTTVAKYQEAFTRGESEVGKIDYGPPQKWRDLAPEKKTLEKEALDRIVAGTDVARNYDDWRKDIDKNYVIATRVLDDVAGWPPDWERIKSKIGELDQTLNNAEYPPAKLKQATSESVEFGNRLKALQETERLLRLKSRQASSATDNRVIKSEAESLIRDFGTALDKVSLANAAGLKEITDAQAAKKQFEQAKTAKRIEDLNRAAGLVKQDDWPGVSNLCAAYKEDDDFKKIQKDAQKFEIDLKKAADVYTNGDYAAAITIVNSDRVPTRGFTNILNNATSRQEEFLNCSNSFVREGNPASLISWIVDKKFQLNPLYATSYTKGTNYQDCSERYAKKRYVDAQQVCVKTYMSESPFLELLNQITSAINDDYANYANQLRQKSFAFIKELDEKGYYAYTGGKSFKDLIDQAKASADDWNKQGNYSTVLSAVVNVTPDLLEKYKLSSCKNEAEAIQKKILEQEQARKDQLTQLDLRLVNLLTQWNISRAGNDGINWPKSTESGPLKDRDQHTDAEFYDNFLRIISSLTNEFKAAYNGDGNSSEYKKREKYLTKAADVITSAKRNR